MNANPEGGIPMGRRPLSLLRHARTMVGRTFRSYAMLSVTIVLSFSLLLAYLIFTDSSLYNRYKDIFARDRSVITVRDIYLEQAKVNLLLEKAGDIGQTHSYTYFAAGVQIYGDGTEFTLANTGETLSGSPVFSVYCLPQNTFGLYEWGEEIPVTWLAGQERDHLSLSPGEAVMEESWFQALGLDEQEEPVYSLCLRDRNTGLKGEKETFVERQVRIVGTVRTTEPISFDPDLSVLSLRGSYSPSLLLSAADFGPDVMPKLSWTRTVVFYTDSPEQVEQLAESMRLEGGIDSVFQAQNKALETIRTEKRTKAVITAALLLLLGINLYSSFSNALNDRKFEIGVKRAVGASKWSIIRQFLYESILVMLVNILLSIVLVTDLCLVYKRIYETTPNVSGLYFDWIVYASPHSVAMFAVCSVTLTIVFSLIFAYKSTQVEIVQYLKAE